MRSAFSAAVFQMATQNRIEASVQKIRDAIDRAHEQEAHLLVLPEGALGGYLPPRDLDFDLLGKAQTEVAAHSAAAGIWLALGTTRQAEGGWRNSALLYSPAGEMVACYDKTHLTEGDSDVFAPGDDLPVFQVGEWTVGIQICFDMRFPENWRILRRKGAELVLHLSNASLSGAWKMPVLEGAVRSRAAENGMFVVSANDARAPQMMVSAICDPDGRDLARAPENEEAMLFARLDRSCVKTDFLECRRTDLWDRPENRPLLLS